VINQLGYFTIIGRKVQLYVKRNVRSFRSWESKLPELPESIYNLLSNCTLNLAEPGAESKRKPPVIPQEAG
jgi:hypothetical protein